MLRGDGAGLSRETEEGWLEVERASELNMLLSLRPAGDWEAVEVDGEAASAAAASEDEDEDEGAEVEEEAKSLEKPEAGSGPAISASMWRPDGGEVMVWAVG